jgi:hypothetical protein
VFVGHLAVGLAAKRVAPDAKLGWLIAGATALDLVWPIFVLTGIEHVRIEPGATAFTPLVEVLRMKHCPDRYDFGLRYLDRDVPPEVRREIESLVLPATPEEIVANRARAETMFHACLRDLDAAD